jgi:hypothetical protein
VLSAPRPFHTIRVICGILKINCLHILLAVKNEIIAGDVIAVDVLRMGVSDRLNALTDPEKSTYVGVVDQQLQNRIDDLQVYLREFQVSR